MDYGAVGLFLRKNRKLQLTPPANQQFGCGVNVKTGLFRVDQKVRALSKMDNDKLLVHVSVTTGHHLSYQKLLLNMLNGKPSIGEINFKVACSLVLAEKVFFSTIDVDYKGFFCVALLRAMVGKKTAGFFIRPLTCIEKKPKPIQVIKYFCFRFINVIESIRIISIIPFYINEKLSRISRNWIYDPQFWDLEKSNDFNIRGSTEIFHQIVKKAGSRRVLAFIGGARPYKCFEEFFCYAVQNREKIFSVVIGRVDKEYQFQVNRLRELGMIVEDRYVSDQEIEEVYSVSNLVWCYYSPAYDQSSGVFGRALQTGVTPILRKGSVVDLIRKKLEEDGIVRNGKIDVQRIRKSACEIILASWK